ncbi:MAG: metallophosphoesterase [Fimbriimonadaceae bacterium]|nr:metallophosphoesterase [Fimbriimonadaceae bacterium]
MAREFEDESASPRISRRGALIGGAITGAAIFGVRGMFEADELAVERRTLVVPGADADGLKIAFLTDWHLNDHPSRTRATRATRLALGESPDLIVLGGDYCSRRILLWREMVVMEQLTQLVEAGVPVVGILGNHDYHGEGIAKLADWFRRCGATLLVNEFYRFQGVRFLGLDDAMFGSPDFRLLSEETRDAVLLLHEPDWVPNVAGKFSVALSGHTHGGQVCAAPMTPIYLPNGGKRFVSGEYALRDSRLYISRGVGMTGLNIRTFCPPEVTILTLKSA